jgi:carboxypeptidase PM20D1
VRTTTALTIFRAGAKENALPASASAILNHRIHPADSVASVVERDRRVINDPSVKIEV